MRKSDKMTSALEEKVKPVEMIPQLSTSKGRTTQQLMRKHIQDANDVITDEDFKNLHLDLELPNDEAHQPLIISNNTDRPKDEDKDPKVLTPWDLIN